MNLPKPKSINAAGPGPASVQSLCTKCGLCCNGVLFADVELRKTDSTAKLRSLDLELYRKGRSTAFNQPCRCFNGGLCAIYDERPAHCRAFECALLQRAIAGTSTVSSALKTIALAKRKVKRVDSILMRSAEDDASLALTLRYSKVVRAPIDLSTSRSSNPLGRLMPAMADLMDLLQKEFLRPG